VETQRVSVRMRSFKSLNIYMRETCFEQIVLKKNEVHISYSKYFFFQSS
jgi:hypothetical protein